MALSDVGHSDGDLASGDGEVRRERCLKIQVLAVVLLVAKQENTGRVNAGLGDLGGVPGDSLIRTDRPHGEEVGRRDVRTPEDVAFADRNEGNGRRLHGDGGGEEGSEGGELGKHLRRKVETER